MRIARRRCGCPLRCARAVGSDASAARATCSGRTRTCSAHVPYPHEHHKIPVHKSDERREAELNRILKRNEQSSRVEHFISLVSDCNNYSIAEYSIRWCDAHFVHCTVRVHSERSGGQVRQRQSTVLERQVDVHCVRERVNAGVGARADERAHRLAARYPLHRLQRLLPQNTEQRRELVHRTWTYEWRIGLRCV